MKKQSYEIKLVLTTVDSSAEYKLNSEVSSLTLYVEALADENVKDGALGGAGMLMIPFRNDGLRNAYFQKIKADQRIISIE